MIDEIFKVRFVEEVVNISKVKDKKTRLRMHVFGALSFLLAFGSTVASFELIVNAVMQPGKRYLAYYIVIFILLGFAITFWLTFVIFVIAYARNAMIRRCLLNLSCGADKKEVSPGDDITVDVKFDLVKKEIERVRLELVCQRETILKVLDMPSVKMEKPYRKEIIIDENLVPKGETSSYKLEFKIPEDALKTQPVLSDDRPKIIWGVTVYFDFLNWYSYEKDIPLIVK